ncbi:hypothetical protein Q31b_58730 [Novipirellula aureliae]|uniref:Uncharacterized protein n=2 Tax=Novipirellula aureliae TaxID=2527966 RepID=A0A5C6D4C8_9BACT|nr:hypothetical protein Q31b_58730 [Novipirellula aureliae]
MIDANVRKRRRLRFSIRALLVLTFVCAFPFWWIASQLSARRSEVATVARIQAIVPDASIQYENMASPWMLKLGFRPDFTQRVYAVDVTGQTAGMNANKFAFEFDDDDLTAIAADLRSLRELQEVYLQFSKVTDQSLAPLGTFESVRFLNLQQTAMSSDAVKTFASKHPGVKVAFFYKD